MTKRELHPRTRSNILRYYTQDWESTLDDENSQILSAPLWPPAVYLSGHCSARHAVKGARKSRRITLS